MLRLHPYLIVMQHMIAPLQAVYLEQFCDILKPGGQMYIHTPTKTPHVARLYGRRANRVSREGWHADALDLLSRPSGEDT